MSAQVSAARTFRSAEKCDEWANENPELYPHGSEITPVGNDWFRVTPKAEPKLKVQDAAELFDHIQRAQNAPREDTRDRFNIITCEELEKRPSLDYLIKGVLLRTEFAGILGAPGDGKTLLAVDMECAMSSGTDWHGHKVPGKLDCVHVWAEGAAGAPDRIRAVRKHRGLSVADMPRFILDTPNIKTEADTRLLAKKIGRADAIFLDTFAATLAGSENEGKDVQPYISNCQLLHNLTGALVVILCHPGKAGTEKGVRGWSGTLGALDTLIEIERTGDYRAVRVRKQKDSAEGPLLGFTVQTVDVGRDRDGDPRYGAVLVPAHAPAKKVTGERTRSGKNVDAVRSFVHASGKSEFDVTELTADIAATLPKTGKKDRRLTEVGRAIRSLTGDFFEVVPDTDGERVRTRGPVRDDAEWLG